MRTVTNRSDECKVELQVWETSRWKGYVACRPELVAIAVATPAEATTRQLDRLRLACLAAVEANGTDARASQTVAMPSRSQAEALAAAFRPGASVIDFEARSRVAWLRRHHIELPPAPLESLLPPAM